MPKIKFTDVLLKKVDFSLDHKTSQVHVNLHMAAAWGVTVRDKLGWGDIPDWQDNPAKLKGELVATAMVLTPKDDKLAAEQFEIACHSVGNFQAFRISENENSSRIELRFTVCTRADDAEALAGAYLRRIGLGKGLLRVDYQKQMELGETAEEAAIEEAQEA